MEQIRALTGAMADDEAAAKRRRDQEEDATAARTLHSVRARAAAKGVLFEAAVEGPVPASARSDRRGCDGCWST